MSHFLQLAERYFVGACSVFVMGLALLPQLPAVVGEVPPAQVVGEVPPAPAAVVGDEGVVEPLPDRRRAPPVVVVTPPNPTNMVTIVGMLVGMVMGVAKLWFELEKSKQAALGNRDRIVQAETKVERVESKVDQLNELMAVDHLQKLGDLVASDNPQTILIVDDDSLSARAYERILLAHGFLTKRAESVHEAISRLDQGPIHAILLDLKLPDGDGEEVLREVRRRALPIRVIINTGIDDPSRRAALAEVADVVLIKPRDIPRLIAALYGPTANTVTTTDDGPPPKAV